MKTESGSMMISSPDEYDPPEIHVHAVEMRWRSLPSRPSRPMNAATAPPKATKEASVARKPAPRRESRLPESVMTPAATSGESRQVHAPQIIRGGLKGGRRRA